MRDFCTTRAEDCREYWQAAEASYSLRVLFFGLRAGLVARQAQPRARLVVLNPLQRNLPKKFHVGVVKLPCSRRGIGAMASRILDMGN